MIIRMKKIILASLSVLAFFSCQAPLKINGRKPTNPLERMLAAQGPGFDTILGQPQVYEVQIIYTQIDRDASQRPRFTSYFWNVDSTRYFYPASTVKMPLALLALEQINRLRKERYPGLSKDSPYRLDSLRAYQQHYADDPTAPQGKATLAQDIRKIFVASDNLAYNHLFEFLGREYINTTLHQKGYTRTGIVHRFNFPGRDNRYSSPITFFGDDFLLYQPEQFDPNDWVNPQHHLVKGRGYIDGRDSLVQVPFDFTTKNWFALTDMEKMLRAVFFPEATPATNRFDLTTDDYQFVRHYMGIFPQECDYPRYDPPSAYNAFGTCFLWGDTLTPRDGSVRAFNKIGGAYGTLTDVAYIVDFEHQVEFILAATILCNSNGIFNDNQYDYERIGYPFLGQLGQAVLNYERSRKRKVRPDLVALQKSLPVRKN